VAEYEVYSFSLPAGSSGPLVSSPVIKNRIPSGAGYLAGSFPGGTTTVEGVPVSATIRVLLRAGTGHPEDGALVAEVESLQDGTWMVEGLPTDLRFDVVGRKDGFNDVIVANITPSVA